MENRFEIVFRKLQEAIDENDRGDHGSLQAESEEIEALRKVVLEVNKQEAIYLTST